MYVYFVAVAFLLFYLCMIPVKIGLLFRTQPRPTLQIGVGFFEKRFAERSAAKGMEKSADRSANPDHAAKPPSPPLLRALLRAGRCLLRRMRLEQLRISGVIATEDAAQTALICGAAQAIHAACAPLGDRLYLYLRPVFSASGDNRSKSDVEICGIIVLRAGHIIFCAGIFAVALAAEACREVQKRLRSGHLKIKYPLKAKINKWRFRKWTADIPSKTSCRPRWRASAT